MKKLITILLIACSSYFVLGQEVKINSNLAIEADGTVRMDNAAMVWDDLRVPLSEPSTGNIKPTWATFPYGSSGSVPFINWFKDGGIDEMYFFVQLPHDWKEGTSIYPHIHWSPSQNGGSGPTVPRWGLQYTWANIGEAFPAYTTIYGTTTFPSETLVKDKMYLTPLFSGTTNEGISGTDKTISSMLVCRIFRDGDSSEDNFSGLAGALEIDFHYERNTLGSRTEYAK